MSKLLKILNHEIGWIFGPRVWLLNLLLAPLPIGSAGRIRAAIYRLFGAKIGKNTMIWGAFTFCTPEQLHKNLTIGNDCYFNGFVHLDITGPVHIGNGVSIGHHTIIITSDHEIGPSDFRAGPVNPKSVTIGDGAWIAAGAIVMPGVTIGAGSVVSAGTLVHKDVPPNSVMAGVPGRIVRKLENTEGDASQSQSSE